MELIFIAVIIIVAAAYFIPRMNPVDDEEVQDAGPKQDFSMYERKSFLFDNKAEFDLFKDLLEICGDTCHVFPQVHYVHLVSTKQKHGFESKKHRSRIDKKSADFVICDRKTAVPRLVIELDGSAHNRRDKQDRDRFIDALLQQVGLPIIHVKRGGIDKQVLRVTIETAIKAS